MVMGSPSRSEEPEASKVIVSAVVQFVPLAGLARTTVGGRLGKVPSRMENARLKRPKNRGSRVTGLYSAPLKAAKKPVLKRSTRVRFTYIVMVAFDETTSSPSPAGVGTARVKDRKSTRLNSSHPSISYAVFCLKKKIGQRRVVQLPFAQRPAEEDGLGEGGQGGHASETTCPHCRTPATVALPLAVCPGSLRWHA